MYDESISKKQTLRYVVLTPNIYVCASGIDIKHRVGIYGGYKCIPKGAQYVYRKLGLVVPILFK